jgi:RNA polymerase sigma-70 factor
MEQDQTSDPGAAGDPGQPDRYEEFLKLFARDRERIFAYIYSLLPHHADAEDVFQRCSLLLWRKIGHYDGRGGFLSWACGVAFYEVCNFLRVAGRNRLRFDLDLVSQLAERRLETIDRDEERLAALGRCLEKLKDDERTLIEHVYGEDHSVKELAESTGRASQTLYNRLSQIRRKLFDCVQHALATQG